MSLEDDISATREGILRQANCSIKDCYACQANRDRQAASERVIDAALRGARMQSIYDAWVTAGRPK